MKTHVGSDVSITYPVPFHDLNNFRDLFIATTCIVEA